jgi:hypothetical protein
MNPTQDGLINEHTSISAPEWAENHNKYSYRESKKRRNEAPHPEESRQEA